jgi:hypothetical protein
MSYAVSFHALERNNRELRYVSENQALPVAQQYTTLCSACTMWLTQCAFADVALLFYYSFECIPYRLVIDEAVDKPELVFASQMQRNSVTEDFVNLNWLRYRVGRPLTVPLRIG